MIELWDIANENRDLMRFSTLITAQNVRDLLSTAEGLNNAIDWCKKTAVTHVYIESFRDGYTADMASLERAKAAFLDAGIDVSGCVTTTQIGKGSTGWKTISCYTNNSTQERLQEIFEYTATIFDEIMIDDFLFTDCECDECKAARKDKTWVEYRRDLMLKVSNERILKAAKAKNPNAKIIIKYPQWYDDFHNRGYDVVGETSIYDKIWVGTETRDPDNERWGRKAQYEAYYIMRWLGVIGGEKTGGGWYDPYGTTPPTYVEQARQTVLADAKESLLFCYGSLLTDTGPSNIEKLRTEIPGLFELAKVVRGKSIKGILAPKPPNSEPHNEKYIFDFVGMLGLPLIPSPEIGNAESYFFSIHSLKDKDFVPKLRQIISDGKPVLITDNLWNHLKDDFDPDKFMMLHIKDNPRSLLNMDRASLAKIRERMLKPYGITFDAPNKVSLYLIGDDYVIVENFNDASIDASLHIPGMKNANGQITLPVDGKAELKMVEGEIAVSMSPRSLAAIKIQKE